MFRVVFWTECINFHTLQLFECFGCYNDVVIAYCNRSFRGYVDLKINNCKTVQILDFEDCIKLMEETSDYIHISNAFKTDRKYAILKEALKELVRRKFNLISLFQEQYPYTGFKGFLRSVKWFYIYNFGIGKTHKLIGYCGQRAYISLRRSIVGKQKLAEFIYTPWYDEEMPIVLTDVPTFIMVGQLVERKRVIETVKIFKSLDKDFVFKIIGDGVQKKELEDLIHDDSRIKFLGRLSPSEVQREYAESDYLVLSSAFDGWGCSVNEAITQGCKVIVSDHCGASSLILDHPFLGLIFKSDDWNMFGDIVKDSILGGSLSYETKFQIKTWSKRISPHIESNYLTELLNSLHNGENNVHVPWK